MQLFTFTQDSILDTTIRSAVLYSGYASNPLNIDYSSAAVGLGDIATITTLRQKMLQQRVACAERGLST